jgi:glycosyltransferase involved in cell wall biosynthesis
MRGVYVTFDNLDPNSGAGKVCLHEINALKKVCDYVGVVSREDLAYDKYYDFNPFLWDYFAAAKLRKMLKGLKVDILHLSCSPAMSIMDVVTYKKAVCNIVAHDLNESIAAHEKMYGVGTYPFKHNTVPELHELLLKHTEVVDRILTPSTAAQKWIMANMKGEMTGYHYDWPEGAAQANTIYEYAPLPPVTVIPHGCEIPAEVFPGPDTYKVGYMGAFGPDKGIEYMLDAFNRLTDGKLVLAGKICGHVSDGPTVEKMGWVENISSFYNNISVYVQPSVTEGFGIEILEAMAHERPVIASVGAGGADAITHGEDGFIVPAKDADAILFFMNLLKNNPDMLKTMGEKARIKANKYTWENIEHKYVEMYKAELGLD